MKISNLRLIGAAKGFSLIEALVASGLVAIVGITFIMRYWLHSNKVLFAEVYRIIISDIQSFVVLISPGIKATWTRVIAPPQRLQVSTSIFNGRLSRAAQVNLFFSPFYRLPGPWHGGAGVVAWTTNIIRGTILKAHMVTVKG